MRVSFFLRLGVAAALPLAATGASAADGASAANASTSSSDDAQRGRWFMDMYAPDESRLIWQIGGWGGWASNGSSESAACGGAPFLLTRTAAPNGNCPARLSRLNASCTCVAIDSGVDVTKATSIKFHVQRQSPAAEGDSFRMPATVKASDTVSVSTIASFGIPVTLRSLTIVGNSLSALDIPLGVRWGAGGPGSTQSALIQNEEGTNLTAVTLENLDLTNVSMTESFFPATLTSLALRNCYISGFSMPFISELGNLQSLDLSTNSLGEPYEKPQIERCATGLCLLKSLNLSNNFFSTLPTSTKFFDSLKVLDLTGNPITNYTVAAEIFDAIASLDTFLVTPLEDPVDCAASTTKRTVHSVDFCVAPGSTPSTTSSSPSANSNASSAASGSRTNTYLLFGVIAGCALVAVLLFIILRQRREHRKAKQASDTYTLHPFATGSEQTALGSAFDESFYNTGTANLLNDPIIITRRVQQSDIKVAACISQGGFGIVYSGVYRRRRRVAIKKIRPEYNTNLLMIETFLKEICLMATLRHARIVEFIGVAWESPRDLCAVTEYMEKGDVRDLLHLQRRKGRPVATWANRKKTQIALHVAEGLQYLHALRPKVIHRDLKAKNVLLNAKFEAKLSDFGISRERHGEKTHMTSMVGTSFWIAPEVLLGREDYDERADIYSFGVLLCEIDTEDYPYWHEDYPERGNKAKEQAILRKVASGALRPEFAATCPAQILALAEACLEKDPARRPTARTLVDTLAAMLQDQQQRQAQEDAVDDEAS